MIAGRAAQVFGAKLNDEQEILMNIADMLIEIYVAESTVLRTEKLADLRGEDAVATQIAAAKVYFFEAMDTIESAAREALFSFTQGDEQRVMMMGLKRYLKPLPVNVKELRRQIAAEMIEKGGYVLSA